MCPAVLYTFTSKLCMKLGSEFYSDAKLSTQVLKRRFFFLKVLAIGENVAKGGM
jgi:hypothetical protein